MLVPRPTSSRTTRLRAVALLRMFAVSLISTMKVDCPDARSSCAPTLVKIRSTRPIRALSAGHERTHLGEQDAHGDLPQVGGLAGCVRPGNDMQALGIAIHERIVG